jgi:HD-GYP domain-containing protein (c-di-GMP phosphodiesterase class II)
MTRTTNPAAVKIFEILREGDKLELSVFTRQVQENLAMQAASVLDEALPWQRGHGRRTARLSQTLGAAAGLPCHALHDLTLASFLHDIGLLALPINLIAPASYLDAHSYAAIQSHPRLGAQWLESFLFLRGASVIVAHHHERWDGSGYPYGIRGTFIPVEARVLAIADALDAITVPGIADQKTRRRVVYPIIQAAAGTQFDAQLVELGRHVLGGRLVESQVAQEDTQDSFLDFV